jgi:hypothetical protein
VELAVYLYYDNGTLGILDCALDGMAQLCYQ